MTPNNSRWRFNSLLGVLTPKVGVELRTSGQAFFVLGWPNLSYSLLLHDHLALDLSLGMLIRKGKEHALIGAHFDLRLLVF